MKQYDIIYEYCKTHVDCEEHGYYKVVPRKRQSLLGKLKASYVLDIRSLLGWAMLAIGLGGITGPMIPNLRMEMKYAMIQNVTAKAQEAKDSTPPLPASVPVVFEPLIGPDGNEITPVDTQFGLVVPKIGINARIIPGVDPSTSQGYTDALKAGIAHANTSFYPDEDGTVYLFSHSTNYEWFIKDLNAIFYLLKNVETGDTVVIFYNDKRYTYRISDKKVVSPYNTSYIMPYAGRRNLILQTCWPPGSTTERLLIFADLIEDNGKQV